MWHGVVSSQNQNLESRLCFVLCPHVDQWLACSVPRVGVLCSQLSERHPTELHHRHHPSVVLLCWSAAADLDEVEVGRKRNCLV